MRLHWMYGALLAAAIASPSSAQVSVYIGTPPPAIVNEEPGPPLCRIADLGRRCHPGVSRSFLESCVAAWLSPSSQ